MASSVPPESSTMPHVAMPGAGSNDSFSNPPPNMEIHQQMLQQQEQQRMECPLHYLNATFGTKTVHSAMCTSMAASTVSLKNFIISLPFDLARM